MVSVRITFDIDPAPPLGGRGDEVEPAVGLVRRGLQRLTPNAMHVFAPTILLAPALYLDSLTATVAALANWGILWIHHACTEKPDLRRIWGGFT